MSTWQKYASRARGWSSNAYADPTRYLAARAELVVALGPRLVAGDTVLDLACGDGRLAEFLPGLRYVGVDASAEMVAEGRALGRDVRLSDLNDFAPSEPAEAITIFRAIYYARDRRALFAHLAAFATKKVVFDLNPRQYELADVRVDLAAAGLPLLAVRPFFVPQTRAMPAPVAGALRALERTGPLAGVLLRRRFTLLCAAYRADAA